MISNKHWTVISRTVLGCRRVPARRSVSVAWPRSGRYRHSRPRVPPFARAAFTFDPLRGQYVRDLPGSDRRLCRRPALSWRQRGGTSRGGHRLLDQQHGCRTLPGSLGFDGRDVVQPTARVPGGCRGRQAGEATKDDRGAGNPSTPTSPSAGGVLRFIQGQCSWRPPV